MNNKMILCLLSILLMSLPVSFAAISFGDTTITEVVIGINESFWDEDGDEGLSGLYFGSFTLNTTGDIYAGGLKIDNGPRITWSSDHYDLNISCENIVGGSDSDFCADATGGGGGDGVGGIDDTHFYLFQSMKTDVIWNLTESDFLNYNFHAKDNVIISPIGGEIQ